MCAADLLKDVRAAGFTLDLADGKLLVAPASMLTDELRTALRANKTEVLALLAAEHDAEAEAFEERAAIMEFDGGLPRTEAEAAARQCVDCEHFGQRRTCLEPVAAGLLTQAQGFGIVWPSEKYGAVCPAFIGELPTATASRARRLLPAGPDRCHVKPWDDAAEYLRHSVASRRQRIAEAEKGIYLPSSRLDEMEAGRFATPATP